MDFHRGQVAIGQRASSRQERYASYAEFEGVMRKASVFRRLNGEAVELYAAATFRPDGGGGVVLRCPRDYEAQVFLDNKVSTVALALQRLPPIAVIGGEPNDGVTDMPSRICAALFPEWGIPYECVPQTTHFLQIEQPGDCAERTLRHLQGWL
jgi:hypothetical protein